MTPKDMAFEESSSPQGNDDVALKQVPYTDGLEPDLYINRTSGHNVMGNRLNLFTQLYTKGKTNS